MTTWAKRINNLPFVLDSIYTQSIQPDIVVVNLSFNEIIPPIVCDYIAEHQIEVNRVPDNKVYKKILPTLSKYPNDCIISVDDDWLYPSEMIEVLMATHEKYPDYPVSGNCAVQHQLQCHCGCASLVKAAYFDNYLSEIDDSLIENCPSDDMVYTYLAYKAGHPYIRSIKPVFSKLTPFNNEYSYSESSVDGGGIEQSYSYLLARFGEIDTSIKYYNMISDSFIKDLISDIVAQSITDSKEKGRIIGRSEVMQSTRYRFGNAVISPISFLINKFFKKQKTTNLNLSNDNCHNPGI